MLRNHLTSSFQASNPGYHHHADLDTAASSLDSLEEQEQDALEFYEEIIVVCDWSTQGFKEMIKNAFPKVSETAMIMVILFLVNFMLRFTPRIFFVIVLFIMIERFVSRLTRNVKLDVKIDLFAR